jgi:uncharacterized protein YndB with AHSA1/START domain
MTPDLLQTVPGDDPLVLECTLPASCDQLFRAWTEPDEVMQWFGYKAGSMISAEIDLREGGAWRFVMVRDEQATRALQGTYSAIEPGKRLEFTWQHVVEAVDGTRTESGISQVRVEFSAHGKATRLNLRHEGIEARDSRLGVGAGWNASLNSLAAHVESAGQG